MASSPDIHPTSGVGDVFRSRMLDMQKYAASVAKSLAGGKPAVYFRPEGLTAPLSDGDAISPSFTRQQQEDDFVAAVKDSEQPGTVGDLHLVSLQGDFLAMMERAYRARHASSVRTRVHACGRAMGQAAETGVIRGGMLGFVEQLDAMNRSEGRGGQ